MKNRQIRSNNTAQRGNALILLLVTIGLLAALSLAIMRTSSKTQGDISEEQARILAEQIMRSAQTYETAVQRLVNINRCSENELNFANAYTTIDYTNAAAPADNHCDLFNANGAGLQYGAPNPDFLDPANSAKTSYGDLVWNASQCILDIGTGDSACSQSSTIDLILIIPHIREDICIEINKMNGITNPSGIPPTEEQQGSTFDGSFTVNTDPEIGDTGSGTNLVGHATGCFRDTAGTWANSYIFYHVILSR